MEPQTRGQQAATPSLVAGADRRQEIHEQPRHHVGTTGDAAVPTESAGLRQEKLEADEE